MCGSIRISETAPQALEYSLAYARSMADDGDEPNEYRRQAQYFIDYYTPASQRVEATRLLFNRTDDKLTTELRYWADVVI